MRCLGACLLFLAAALPATAHDSGHDQRLPVMGPAPAFTLTDQRGALVSLDGLREKVLAVAFVFTACGDTCPLLVEKMAGIRSGIDEALDARLEFVLITIDPEHDTPDVLRAYAGTHGLDSRGWELLTGTLEAVRDVARRYGVAAIEHPDLPIEHTTLTSVVDRRGQLRVQYLGTRFNPDEFRHDLLELLNES